jgi:hypothetical protein
MPILIRHDPIEELAGLAANVGGFATQGVQAQNRRERDRQAMAFHELQMRQDEDMFRRDMAHEQLVLQRDRFGLEVDELNDRRNYNQQLLDDKPRQDEERFARLVYQEQQRLGRQLTAQELEKAKFKFTQRAHQERMQLDQQRVNLQGQSAAQRHQQAEVKIELSKRKMAEATNRGDEAARFKAEDDYHAAWVEKAEAAYEHWKGMTPKADPTNHEKFDPVDVNQIRVQLERAISELSKAREAQMMAAQLREQIIRTRMQQQPATQPGPATRPGYQIGQTITSPDGRQARVINIAPDGSPIVEW